MKICSETHNHNHRGKNMNDFDEWWQEFTLLVEFRMSIQLEVSDITKFYTYFVRGLTPSKTLRAYYLGACNK